MLVNERLYKNYQFHLVSMHLESSSNSLVPFQKLRLILKCVRIEFHKDQGNFKEKNAGGSISSEETPVPQLPINQGPECKQVDGEESSCWEWSSFTLGSGLFPTGCSRQMLPDKLQISVENPGDKTNRGKFWVSDDEFRGDFRNNI